ncbi:Ig-like domain-containing protein [Legionella sp. D16C41]|uniref:Ig-like domain-containing protein n=1 Tax=Legionella sp. D16C41 TaxID=3402688 RepID=UPI003AF583A3
MRYKDVAVKELTPWFTKIKLSKRASICNYFRSFIVSLLIFSQVFQIVAAAVVPALPKLSSSTPLSSLPSNSSLEPGINGSPVAPLTNYTETRILNNLSLTSQQLGLSSRLNWGITYSDLTGTFFNAQYVLPLSENLVFGALGEYGSKQYRINGTLGYSLSPLAQVKFTAERFDQRLPFQFDSGNIKSQVHQDAYGVRFQQLFNLPFVQGINAGGYYAKADNKHLSSKIFMSNGQNCEGFAAGLLCINYRNIAGATSQGLDAGIDFLLTPSTLVSGNVYYDEVRYNTIFKSNSREDRDGLGAGIKVDQLLDERFKVRGEATAREIYDKYLVEVSWLPNWQRLGMELSLIGQYITSHNATPNNSSVSLQINLLADGSKLYDERYLWGGKRLNDITQWVQTPAVKMDQVLAIAEQITKLLAPSIIGLTPNSGPFAGGNLVTITGSNFAQGLLVFFGGQLATNIEVLSPTRVKVIVPPVSLTARLKVAAVSDELVDVVVQNPNGQQASFLNGYTYIDDALPTIKSFTPARGKKEGGLKITITGAHLKHTQNVLFGGVAASNVTVINDSTITAITPAGNTGAVDVVVTTLDGNAVFNKGYTYISTISAPLIITPVNGAIFRATLLQKPPISGTGEAGTTVIVRDSNNTILGKTKVEDNGNWTITPNLTVGTYTIRATQANAEDESVPSVPILFTVTDTIAPAAPVITAPTNGSTTNDPTPTISGTGESGATVTVTEGTSTVLGTALVDSGGTWALTPITSLTDGIHTIQATQTDVAGSTSPPSAPVTFTVDTVAPAAPVITSPTNGSTTNDPTPTISGTGESGATVTVRLLPSSTILGTALVSPGGTWALTPTTPLADGVHRIQATQTDAAGNTSPASTPVSFTVDTTAPAAPVITAPTNGSTTNDPTPTISGTGESGATVTVRLLPSSTVLGTALVSPGGTWALTPTSPLTDGIHAIQATQTDAAGNTSPASTPVSFTVDTTAPAAPVITTPTNGSTTNDPTPTISGTGEPGATASVLQGSTVLGTALVNPGGTWALTPATPLADGTYTIRATQTDAAGNISPASTPVTFTVDTVVAAPVITTPTNGSIINDPTPTISGTGEPGATVTVLQGSTVLGTALVNPGGTWALTLATPLADGTYTIQATQTDAAGNTSPASTPVTFTVDTVVAAPVITTPTNGSIINDPTPTISGTGEPGATVTVVQGNTVLGTALVSSEGNWALRPIILLADGIYTIRATQTDAAGNTSPASIPVTFTIKVTGFIKHHRTHHTNPGIYVAGAGLMTVGVFKAEELFLFGHAETKHTNAKPKHQKVLKRSHLSKAVAYQSREVLPYPQKSTFGEAVVFALLNGKPGSVGAIYFEPLG